MTNIGLILDRIEKRWAQVFGVGLIAAVLLAISILCGAGMSQAQPSDPTITVPQSRDYISTDSKQLVGLTQDRGRVTLTIDWSGRDSKVLQMGRVVQGEWVPYVIDVKYDRATYPDTDQVFVLLIGGNHQLVTLTTTGAKPSDVVQVREFPSILWFAQHRSVFNTIVSAQMASLPLG